MSEAFAYDPAGTRIEHTNTDGDTIGFTVDDTGQLVSDTSGTTYSYDSAGNLTAPSAGDEYVYDDCGRTITATGDGVTQQYVYDAADVRVDVDGVDQLWDRNGLPTLISTSAGDNYLHTAGIARDGDDWLLADAVGSVRAVVDNTGATVGSQDFSVFGEQLAGDGTFGFAGEQQDPTGLLHLRARDYHPTLGRFTTVDPVQPGAPGTTGYNLYAYSGNNPTTWTDPSGQAALSEYVALSGRGAAIGGVIGFGVGSFVCADGQAGLGGAEAQASTSLRSDLAIDALEMAVWNRQRQGHDLDGLTHHSDRGVQCLSISYSERLADNDIVASVGSKGDSYDNALVESFNGLYKWELIYPQGPWRGLDDVEFATMTYVDWFNHRRVHSGITDDASYTTPAEHEAKFYTQTQATKLEAATH